MKPQPVYYHYAHTNKDELQSLADKVLQFTAAAKIFLLGTTVTGTRTESLFTVDSASTKNTSHYFILVLVQKEDDYSLNAVQDKIENNMQHLIPTTAIVIDIKKFNSWLSEGHPFASYVKETAACLYEGEDGLLAGASCVNEQKWRTEKGEAFKQTRVKIREFMAGAQLFTLRVQYRFAAFMLHQVAEQALLNLFYIKTGLRVTTHNIDKLLRYCSMFNSRLNHLFPKEQAQSKKLFSLLKTAYLDTRYRNDYSISFKELEELTARVRTIEEIFERSGSALLSGENTSKNHETVRLHP